MCNITEIIKPATPVKEVERKTIEPPLEKKGLPTLEPVVDKGKYKNLPIIVYLFYIPKFF